MTPLRRKDKQPSNKTLLYCDLSKGHSHSKQMYHKRMLHQLSPLHATMIHPTIPDNAVIQLLRVRPSCRKLQKETQMWKMWRKT